MINHLSKLLGVKGGFPDKTAIRRPRSGGQPYSASTLTRPQGLVEVLTRLQQSGPAPPPRDDETNDNDANSAEASSIHQISPEEKRKLDKTAELMDRIKNLWQ